MAQFSEYQPCITETWWQLLFIVDIHVIDVHVENFVLYPSATWNIVQGFVHALKILKFVLSP